MTWVKICGITNLEDALTAVDAGADAVGFVFYEKSSRKIDSAAAQEIVSQLPEHVEKVGVFAGSSIRQAVDIGRRAGFNALQLYGMTDPDRTSGRDASNVATDTRGLKTYLALPMSVFLGEGSANLAGFTHDRPAGMFDTLVLDSGNAERPGGTGTPFNWHEAANAVETLSRHQNVVIAGGLSPNNVGEALRILKPFGVDVSSGVEASPGKKDAGKVRAFVKAVRNSDRNMG
jgi:phosphoribosylanthranilate isomerase